MAETFKAPATVKPAAATPSTFYTATGVTALVLGLIATTTTAASIVIRRGKSGDTPGALVDQDLIKVDVAANDSFLYDQKVALEPGDFIEVESNQADTLFNAASILEIS